MSQKPTIYALIVAAGVGARAGGNLPKQYQRVAGKPLLRHSIERLLTHPAIAGVRVVIHPDHAAHYAAATEGLALPSPILGGPQRQDSVRLGLEAMAADAPDYILVHDAARPFISIAMIDRLLAALAPGIGVVPALPVVDTVRRYGANQWHEVSREGLLRIQTPQAFPFAALLALHRKAASAQTDDAALWVDAGHRLEYVEGEEQLRKMTTAVDIAWASQHRTRTVTGMGFDVHALMPAGEKHTIRLGGIDFAHDHKLHGHSDADVVLHAITDALLGTISAGDIGQHFPPSDAKWKGADSTVFLAEAARLVVAQGGAIQHVDVTVICEAPKIGPHREAMCAAIARILDLPLNYVSVKATTTEKLGFTGRGEGIAAQAVATVTLPIVEA